MPDPGMGVLNVATSVEVVVLEAPGTALPTQLAPLVHELSTGAFVQVWLAANEDVAVVKAAKMLRQNSLLR